MLMAEWCVRAVISQEKYQSVFRNVQRVQMVKDVAERFIHALDQRRKGLRVGRFAGLFVVRRKARVGIERRMNRVRRSLTRKNCIRGSATWEVHGNAK